MAPRRCLALGALLLTASAAQAAEPFTFAGPAGRVQIDGPWVLRSDHHNSGIRLGWGNGGFAGSTVTVPYATSANPHRLTGKRGIRMYEGTIAWYRTTFHVPRAGRYAIDFQSVNHRATVWIDGRRIGRSHDGEFQPFAKFFRADGPGRHQLVVRADYANIEHQKATGWHRTWFNFGGINREVTVRPVGRSDIVGPTLTTVLRSSGDAAVTVTAMVRNYGAARSIGLLGTLHRDGQNVAIPFPRVHVAAGATRTVRARVRVPDPALWSPDSPTLYQLDLQVPGEAQYSSRTGLRQLTWSGRRLFLNGRRMVLHGASLHEDAYDKGDALAPADMDTLVDSLVRIHANMTRNHHPLNPALLERLDAAGIMVWQEIGPNDSPGGWKLRTLALKRAGRRRVRESFFQLQLHPSIIVWSLANEVANTGSTRGQRPFIDHVAQELHRRDPGRMVGVDIWGTHVPSTDRGAQLYRHLDVVGLTNYDGWYDNGQARGLRLRRVIRQSLNLFARAFPDKVLMVTEFGGEANNHNARAAAGGYDFQTRLLRDHITTYRTDTRLAGMLVWILRDFAVPPSFAGGSVRHEFPRIRLLRGINQKGLFNYQGAAKPSMPVVARMFGAIPTFPSG
jgi:hypothetical protein